MVADRAFRLLAFAVLVVATPAHAAWPNSPFAGVPVCTAIGNQSAPLAISDGSGGTLVVWTDQRSGGQNDIYAHHILASGVVDPAWPVNGLAVCTATGSQSGGVAIPDGTGGLIVAWQDSRGANADVYAHRVLATGFVDPAWPVNGRAVCTATGNQVAIAITNDGATGALITWQDDRSGSYDVYVHHVLQSGVVDGTWPANGTVLVTAAGFQQNPRPVPDGTGGAVVVWEDSRSGSNDIYAQHVLASGVVDASWPVDGRGLCTSASTQTNHRAISDGAGGAIATWDDIRNVTHADIYAVRVLSNGLIDADWTTNGVLICGAANFQTFPVLTSDGDGGAIIAWRDNRAAASDDVYVQHVDARGNVDVAWPADGRALCTAAGAQGEIAILTDGVGGAVVAWKDDRTGIEDVYASHVLATGVVDPAYPVDGRGVSTASHFQEFPSLVGDGIEGTIVVWRDFRNASHYDILAGRIGRHGFLGTPEPELVTVEDVPNDEGGAVKVSWNASYLDQQSNADLDLYDVLRSVPAATMGLLRAGGTRIRHLGENDLQPGDLVVMPSAATTEYWEFLVSLTARHYLPGYSYIASTLGDSVGGSNPSTAFMVVGRNSATTMWWPSRSMPGYSVDDLAPAAPAPFTGQYGSGTMHLHWNPNGESDLAGYRLYRGSTAGFVPGPGNRIATPPDTGYADPAGAAYFYKLSAVDVHGNESPVATLSPIGLVAVENPVTLDLAFAAPSPNPASRAVSFRFMLPVASEVRLSVFDASGRLVRELANGSRAAGEHADAWDLRGSDGRPAGAGLYFARLEAGGRQRIRRVAVTR